LKTSSICRASAIGIPGDHQRDLIVGTARLVDFAGFLPSSSLLFWSILAIAGGRPAIAAGAGLECRILTKQVMAAHKHLPSGLFVTVPVVCTVVVVALVSLHLGPGVRSTSSILQQLKDPSLEHWFGTDHFGRDMCFDGSWFWRPGCRLRGLLVAVGIGMLLGVRWGSRGSPQELGARD